MEKNLLTHTKHETTHFDVLSDKRQTAKVAFLPFAGKANVKLNLSIAFYSLPEVSCPGILSYPFSLDEDNFVNINHIVIISK